MSAFAHSSITDCVFFLLFRLGYDACSCRFPTADTRLMLFSYALGHILINKNHGEHKEPSTGNNKTAVASSKHTQRQTPVPAGECWWVRNSALTKTFLIALLWVSFWTGVHCIKHLCLPVDLKQKKTVTLLNSKHSHHWSHFKTIRKEYLKTCTKHHLNNNI